MVAFKPKDKVIYKKFIKGEVLDVVSESVVYGELPDEHNTAHVWCQVLLEGELAPIYIYNTYLELA